MKQFLRRALLLAPWFMMTACNTDYNFDNISLEVTVGDTEGIVVPVGSTGEITLSSLLAESGLESDENGNYGFSIGDQMSHTLSLGTIDPITGLTPTIDPISASFIGNINATIPTFEGTKDLALPSGITSGMEIPEGFPLVGQEFLMHYDPHTFEGEFEVEIPEEIAAVKTIRFGAGGEGSLIDIQFDLGGLAGVSDKRHIDYFNIELPAGFTIEKVVGDDTYDYSSVYAGDGSSTPNHFHIEDFTMTGDHLKVDLLIKSVDLSGVTIGADRKLRIDEDVTYDLDFTGSLKAGTVTPVSPSVNISTTLELYDATIVTGDIRQSVSASEHLSQKISLPAEIKEIHSIALVDNTTGSTPTLELKLNIENSPVEDIVLDNVEISLPSYLRLSSQDAAWHYQEGKLTSTTPIQIATTGGEVTFGRFTLEGIGSLDINNGEADLSADLGIKADFVLPAGQDVTIRTQHDDITITPQNLISDLKVESVTGYVEPDLGDLLAPIEVELGDFSSSLEGIELDLNIASPVLRLNIDNPIGVGIDAVIAIDAYKAGAVAKSIATPTISILPADHTSIIITGEDSAVNYPDDAATRVYEVVGLSELIGLLPDKLIVTLDATTNKQTPHTITLQDSYTFNIAYSVEAPIAFSSAKNGHIAYTTTIEDVDLSDLKDIAVEVESLVLNINSRSTLPIDLALSLEMLDSEGEVIPSISATTVGTIKGTTTNEAEQAQSSISLAIDTPEGSSAFTEVARIKSVRCHLEGETLAGGALSKDQFIELGIALLLDKGITVDLGTIGGNKTDEAATE